MHELGATCRSSSAAPAPTRALRFSIDTADPARGALLQRVQERGTRDRDEAAVLRARVGRARRRARRGAARRRRARLRRHHLRTARRYRPHLLTEPEEKILTEKSLTGRAAPGRGCSRSRSPRSRSSCRTADEPVSLEVALSRLFSPDRDVRAHAAERVTAALAARPAHARLRLQHAAGRQDDRRPAARATRTGSRAATSPTRRPTSRSQALIEAVRGRYELPRRWYRLKAQLLGLDRLADYDRMAAVTDDDEHDRRGRDAQRARARLLRRASRPSSAASSRALLRRAAGSTRRCGPASAAARSAPTRCRRVHPYVMLNYTSRRRDVLTLAHELGHGVHAALGAHRRASSTWRTPLTLAETAIVFGETLVFGRLLEQRRRRRSRGCRCWPSRSRARSPPSSARSR